MDDLKITIAVREARFTKIPYAYGRTVVIVETIRTAGVSLENTRDSKQGSLWPRRKKKNVFSLSQETEEIGGSRCEDAIEFYGDENDAPGEVFDFNINDTRSVDRLDMWVEIWAEASEREKQHRLKIGQAKARAHLLVPGLLLDEWRPLETDPAHGEVRFAVIVSIKHNPYHQQWLELFQRSVATSAEQCAERRRQRAWAQKISWKRIVKSSHLLQQENTGNVLFALVRKKNDQAHTLYESWGFAVELVDKCSNNQQNKDVNIIVSHVYDAGGRLEEDISPGDILLACSHSYLLHDLELFHDHLTAAQFDCDAAARHTLGQAAGPNGEHVWLVIKRPQHLARRAPTPPNKQQKKQRARRPSFLSSNSNTSDDDSRDALRELAWRGFARRNRQEVYRGVAFAMEFLSTKRQRRTSSSISTQSSCHSSEAQNAFVVRTEPRHHTISVSSAVHKCVSAFTHHPHNETKSDWNFEQDEEARESLEIALATQHRDAHSTNLRESWHKRQLSFEDALTEAARRQSRAKTQPQPQDSVFTSVKRSSSRLLRKMTKKRRATTGSTGSVSNDVLDDAPRWIIDSLLVATQCALERAPLPKPEQMARGRELLGNVTCLEHAMNDDESDDDLLGNRSEQNNKRHTMDTPSTVTSLAAQMTPRVSSKFLNFREKRKVSTPNIETSPDLPQYEAASNKKNRADRLAFLSERVSRAYLARNSVMSELDGGIHEPTARALAATLLDKVGVDDRTSFYVLAFFFEELGAEAAIHGDRETDVASICSTLFRKRQPHLAGLFERSNFPCNPAVLEVWLTLFPVALPELTLLRWLDVLLFEGWEGMVNLALIWYDFHANEISQALERAFASSTAQPWRSCATVVATLRNIMASSTDVDLLLAKVKSTPCEELHNQAIQMDQVCDDMQDETARHLFDVIMHDIDNEVEHLEDQIIENNDRQHHDKEDWYSDEEKDEDQLEEQIMLIVEESTTPKAANTPRFGLPQHNLLPDVAIGRPPRAPFTPRTPRHRGLRVEEVRPNSRRKRSADDDDISDLPTPSPVHRKKSPSPSCTGDTN